MSEIFEGFTGVADGIRPSCRVAYTINNMQPVSSTIIGEQPFFYMDIDPEEELDELNEMDMEILAEELATLKKEIEIYDRFSGDLEDNAADIFEKFQENKESYEKPLDNNQANFEQLMKILSSSRLCESYINLAKQHNVEITYSEQCEDAHYDRDAALIAINPNLIIEEQVLLATRELRRHWQHRQGAMINPLTFHPDNAILINRVQTADLSVSIVRAAWEMQLAGHREIWDRIEFSPMGDLGRAFAREAFLDFRTINNGLAATAVFESWFLSERCLHADRNLVKAMLADQGGHTFNIDAQAQNITPTLIAALGEMPFGKNYLAQYVYTIMEDSIFCEVRDRSNANFLWFIKFERSFRETERDLQPNDLNENLALNDRSMASHKTDQEPSHAEQHARFHNQQYQFPQGEVVELFAGTVESESADAGDKSGKKDRLLSRKSKKKSKKSSAQIIDLRSRS
ncbi:hypothetical protein N9Z27_02960 [Alphaproteobacteria bacterium]|nr:hypothetical protein [Alphaproteobacteria bacterium]